MRKQTRTAKSSRSPHSREPRPGRTGRCGARTGCCEIRHVAITVCGESPHSMLRGCKIGRMCVVCGCNPAHRPPAMDLRNPYPPEWQSIRTRILKRDGYRCAHCASAERLTVSHINRIEPDCRPANLWTLCRPCHLEYDRADNWRRRRYGRRSHLVQVPIWNAPSPGAGNADGRGLTGGPPRLPVE